MDSKPWYTSRTLWFNAVSLIVAVAGMLLDPQLALDARVVTVLTIVVTVGNMVLRALTNQPIQGTPADVPPRLRGRLE